jgi:hypothetical protein
VSLSPPLTRAESVLPISASWYSKPLGNAMRALCSSPLMGFLIGSTIGFGNTRDPNSRTPFLAIDIEVDRGEERLNQIRANGREDLPVRPAILTAVESNQRVALLLACLFVDNRAPHAVALKYRSRPPIKASETHSVQSGIAKISVSNLPRYKGLAVPGRRHRIKLAGTAQLQLQLASSSPASRHLIFVGSLIFVLLHNAARSQSRNVTLRLGFRKNTS